MLGPLGQGLEQVVLCVPVGASVSPEGLTGEGSTFRLLRETAGGIQFLAGSWTEGISSSWAVVGSRSHSLL